MVHRTLFYWSKLYTEIFQAGQDFKELPKFDIINNKDLLNPLHRWLLFLKEDISTEVLEAIREMDELINKADNKLNFLSADEEVKREYELREKRLSDDRTRMEGAREEGREAKAIEIAKSLLDVLPISEIAKHTRLSTEAIEAIKKQV